MILNYIESLIHESLGSNLLNISRVGGGLIHKAHKHVMDNSDFSKLRSLPREFMQSTKDEREQILKDPKVRNAALIVGGLAVGKAALPLIKPGLAIKKAINKATDLSP